MPLPGTPGAFKSLTALYDECVEMLTLMDNRQKQTERYLGLVIQAGNALSRELGLAEDHDDREQALAIAGWVRVLDLGHDMAVNKKEAPTPQARAHIDYRQAMDVDEDEAG